MQRQILNHSEENNRLFGLLPNLFAYQNAERPKQYVTETKSEISEKELSRSEKAKEAMEKAIEKALVEYNKEYADEDFGSWKEEKKLEKSNKEPLKADVRNASVQETTAQIDNILTAPYLDGERWISPVNVKDDKQCAELLRIRKMITDSNNIQAQQDMGPIQIDAEFLEREWTDTIIIDEEFLKKEWNNLIPRKYRIKNYEFPADDLSNKDKIGYYRNLINKMQVSLHSLPENTDKDILNFLNQTIDRVQLKIQLLDYELNLGEGMLIQDKISAYAELYNKMMKQLDGLPEGTKPEVKRGLAKTAALVMLQITLLKQEASEDTTYDNASAEYHEDLNNSVHEYGDILTGNFDSLDTIIKKKAGMESSKSYQDIESAFDNATITPIISAGKDEFKEFWESSEIGYSSTKFRESKELFFAIMAQQTDEFKNGFILGDKFGENHGENKTNFPFVYNEWIKYNGIDEKTVQAQEGKVSALKSTLAPEMDTPEKVINANYTAGITTNGLDQIKIKYAEQNSREYWKDVENEIGKLNMNVRQKIAKEPNSPNVGGWREATKLLVKHQEIAHQEWIKYTLLQNKDGVGASFTKSNLNKPENRQILVEICMRQFMKAMQVVDKSQLHGDWKSLYDPTVRRLLIATVYEQGVSDFRQSAETGGEPEYVENINKEHYWLLSQLAQSPYFNNEQVNDSLDKNQRGIIFVGLVANKVAEGLEYNKMELEVVTKAKLAKGGDKKAEAELAKYPQALVKYIMAMSTDTLEGEPARLEALIKGREDFIKKTEAAIKNPYLDPKAKDKKLSPDMNTLLKDVLAGNYQDFITKKEMEEYQKMMQGVEINFNALSLEEKSRMDILNKLGIDIRGAYQDYLQELKKDPSMNVDNWDDQFRDEARFNKLQEFLGRILASNNSEGKKAFLETFKTLRGFDPLVETPTGSKDQWNAFQIYLMLKVEMRHGGRITAASNKQQTEVESGLKGMHLGDKATKYAKDVINMLIGPGQSWANRGAALVILFGVLKTIRKAWKPEKGDKVGKLLQILMLAGAAEIVVKKVTGRGIGDRLGLDSIAGKMEGMYECVLLDQGTKLMKKNEVETEEHAGALSEMNKVPFSKLMDWYGKTDDNGMPGEGQTDIFPKQINIKRIVKGTQWKERDKNLEARRIVKLTMLNFFEYVGRKENNKSAKEAGKILKERWVEILKNKDFQPEHTDMMHPELLKDYRQNQDKLTWQIVMRSEIDPYDVEQTKNKHGLAPAFDYLVGKGEGFIRWGRQEVYGPLSGKAEEFYASLGAMAPDVKNFIAEVGEAGGRNLYYAKESAEFWYDANKYEIRKVLGEHWELVKTGVKLPFEVIYAADQAIVPWTLAKINQIKEIVRSDKIHLVQHDLASTDIVPAGVDLTGADQFDPEKNKAFGFYGLYQQAFADAFTSQPDRYFETPKLPEGQYSSTYPDQGVGYLITETTQENAGISPTDTITDIEDRYRKMEAESYEQARSFYAGKGASLDDIDKLMYPIHVIYKGDESKRAKGPEKVYAFWRMPMPGSDEYMMKTTGRWADYINPNKLKDRTPFKVDPNKDMIDNFKDALTLNTGVTRTLIGEVSAYTGQVVHFALASLETAGGIAGSIAGLGIFGAKGDKVAKGIKEATQLSPTNDQIFDEFTNSAGKGTPFAMSDFYRNKDNMRMYKLQYEYALKIQQPLYLGLFEGDTKHLSDWYTKEKPEKFSYGGLKGFYETWQKKNGGPIPGLDKKLTSKENAEKKGQI